MSNNVLETWTKPLDGHASDCLPLSSDASIPRYNSMMQDPSWRDTCHECNATSTRCETQRQAGLGLGCRRRCGQWQSEYVCQRLVPSCPAFGPAPSPPQSTRHRGIIASVSQSRSPPVSPRCRPGGQPRCCTASAKLGDRLGTWL